MALKFERLSAKHVEHARRIGYHADGGGLYLQVSRSRSKSWVFRFTLHGRAREMGLGSLNAVSLADARQRAQEARKLLQDKRDPIKTRDTQRAQEALAAARTITFSRPPTNTSPPTARVAQRQARRPMDQYPRELLRPGVRRATGGRCRYRPRGARPGRDLDEKPETASRLRGRIEAVLDWARVRGYRQGENPARWRGHLDKLLPKRSKLGAVKHHPALPYKDMPSLIKALRTEEGVAARALEFTILTAARTGEVIGAKPAEFDLTRAIWTVPASRMKAGKPHRVPLSPRAVSVVRAQLKQGGEYVFPGGKPAQPLSNMAMMMTLRRMDRDALTVHGFRSSFRDWAAEQMNAPRELAEMALAHTIGDKTEAAYRRGDLFDKRRQLMRDWEKYCTWHR